MENLELSLDALKEKVEDLQRNTKFCVNNYDYHHKNNEREILQNLQAIVQDSLQEAKLFISSMNNMHSSIMKARQKCKNIDEMLMELGYENETIDGVESCIGSRSFHEQETDKYSIDVLEENKENAN